MDSTCLFFGLCYAGTSIELKVDLNAVAVVVGRGSSEAAVLLASTRPNWKPVNVSPEFQHRYDGTEMGYCVAYRQPNFYLCAAAPPSLVKVCEFMEQVVAVFPPACHPGKDSYSLGAPSSCAVDSRGVVYVSDSENRCVNAISANGDLIYRLSRADIRKPIGIDLYESGLQGNRVRLFVADTNGDRVWAFDLP